MNKAHLNNCPAHAHEEKPKADPDVNAVKVKLGPAGWQELGDSPDDEVRKSVVQRLNQRALSQNIVCLVGSGVSLGVGGPSMRDFWTRTKGQVIHEKRESGPTLSPALCGLLPRVSVNHRSIGIRPVALSALQRCCRDAEVAEAAKVVLEEVAPADRRRSDLGRRFRDHLVSCEGSLETEDGLAVLLPTREGDSFAGSGGRVARRDLRVATGSTAGLGQGRFSAGPE